MWNNIHPSDKLTIKATIVLVILLSLCVVVPESFFIWLIVIGSIGYFFYKRPDSNPIKHPSYSRQRYDTYLQSVEWKVKKTEVLIRDSHRCQSCGNTTHLHVHHITYKRLGNENIDDLVTVCRQCHKELHDYYGKNAVNYPLLRSKTC
jgi:hypothetical protein